MSRWIRFFLVSLAIYCLIFLAALVGMKYFGEPYLKEYIESDVAQKFNLNIKVGALTIDYFPPLSLRLTDIVVATMDGSNQIQAANANVTIDFKKIASGLPNLQISARATLSKPVITVKLPYLPPAQFNPTDVNLSPPGGFQVVLPGFIKLNLEVDIQDTDVQVFQQLPDKSDHLMLQLNRLFVQFKMPALDQPWTFHLLGQLIFKKLAALPIPVEVQAQLNLKDQRVFEIQKSDLKFGGIPGVITGWLDTHNMDQAWSVSTDIKDLFQIKSFALPGIWQGSLAANLQIDKSPNLKLQGAAVVKNVYGDIEYSDPKFQIKGNMHIEASTQFEYTNKLKINSLAFDTNLTDLTLAYEKIFKKGKGSTLKASGVVNSDNDVFFVKHLDFQLSQLKGQLSGEFSETNARANIQVPRANLLGLEKFFPVITSPLQGEAEAQISLNGRFSRLEEMTLDINPIVLKNVHINTSWASEDRQKAIEGSVVANTRAVLRTQGRELRSSEIDGYFDLTNLGIRWADLFIKSPGQDFNLEIKTSQKDKAIQINQMNFKTPAGSLVVSGTIQDPLKPQLNLIVTPFIKLEALSLMMPWLKKYKLSGTGIGTLNVGGRWDTALGVDKSPLNINGNLRLHLKEYQFVSSKPVDGKPVVTDAQPTPFLPSNPLVTESIIKTNVHIERLVYNDLILPQVQWKGVLEKGNLSGQLDVKKIFGGNLTVGRIFIPLRESSPKTQINVLWNALSTGQAVDWFFPSWKKLIGGVSRGSMDMVLLPPNHPNFFSDSLVRGKIFIKNSFISTIRFDSLVNDRLSQIPGIGRRTNFQSKGVTSDIQADFEFTREVLKFTSLNIVTPERNELRATGWVRPDKTMEFKGDVALAQAAVGGSVRAANSDALGRFVVPVLFQGSVLSPNLSFAQETVKLLLERTATHEGQKLKTRVQDAATKTISNEVEKAKGHLGERLGQGIKDLLSK